jgi:hypothetical protein
MEDQNHDLILVDALLPNGATIKVAAMVSDAAQDVSFLQVFTLDNLEKSLSGLAEMARNAVAKVAPDTMEIEFGLGLSVEAGKLVSLLTNAGSEASLTVRLGWKRQTAKLSAPIESVSDPTSEK